jgi:hypothetical protein
MTVDVDAVNERLNGLVTLLKAVGVDSLDGKGGASSSRGGMPDARQLDDDQIEAIIKKLQMAQTEAPQIIAALEAQAKLKKQQHQQLEARPPPPQQQQQQHDDDDDDDDSYDEDANYPMVGHGCSDDVSVMSDLTTPTVHQGMAVPDEEHYRDTLPPMIVGGGHNNLPPMLIAPTKRKNLVGNVRSNTLAAPRASSRTAIAKPPSGTSSSGVGGAAAQRRKHYNATMEKLAHEPVQQHQLSAQVRKVKATPTTSATTPNTTNNSTTIKKKIVKTARRASVAHGVAPSNDWEATPQWNAFENAASPSKSHKATTLIDDDGFLMGDTSFDPFQTSAANNPFKSGGNNGFSSSNSTGDAKDKHARRKKKPVTTASSTPATTKMHHHNNNSFDGGFKAPPTSSFAAEPQHQQQQQPQPPRSKPSSSNSAGLKPRRSRRASLAM